jgi:hypothetical protein
MNFGHFLTPSPFCSGSQTRDLEPFAGHQIFKQGRQKLKILSFLIIRAKINLFNKAFLHARFLEGRQIFINNCGGRQQKKNIQIPCPILMLFIIKA